MCASFGKVGVSSTCYLVSKNLAGSEAEAQCRDLSKILGSLAFQPSKFKLEKRWLEVRACAYPKASFALLPERYDKVYAVWSGKREEEIESTRTSFIGFGRERGSKSAEAEKMTRPCIEMQ
jgi:hypothetical protein